MTDDSARKPADPEVEHSPLVRINLGAGRKPRPGWINADVRQGPGIDAVADLERVWPWGDESVDEFYCEDFVEHVRQWWEEPNPQALRDALVMLDAGALGLAIAGILKALDEPVRHYGPIHVMNEAWRCLKPGGHFRVRFPSTDGRGAFQDPTHVSFWNGNSFLYYIDGPVRAGYEDVIKAKFIFEKQSFSMSQAKELAIVWNELLLSKPKKEGGA